MLPNLTSRRKRKSSASVPAGAPVTTSAPSSPAGAALPRVACTSRSTPSSSGSSPGGRARMASAEVDAMLRRTDDG
eukprot:28218-Prymnesium_polylepis.2